MGSDTLRAELDSAGVAYSQNKPSPGVIWNGPESIEIATLIKDAVPWAAIASVLVAWLRARASRKIILTLDDNRVIHAEGMSLEEIQRLLPITKTVSAAETKKPKNLKK